jgi:hypothetical protein
VTNRPNAVTGGFVEQPAQLTAVNAQDGVPGEHDLLSRWALGVVRQFAGRRAAGSAAALALMIVYLPNSISGAGRVVPWTV